MNFDGFLGTRASLMLDVVFLAMFAVLPVMGWSIYLVRFKRNFSLHKLVQLTLGVVLVVAVALFELEMRLYGWEDRATPEGAAEPPSSVFTTLWIHLVFAVSTALLWIFVIAQALRKIPVPPAPCEYSKRHIFWARIAAIDMCLTAVTGWIFYWLAFV